MTNLAAAAEELEGASAHDIVSWAADTYRDGLVLTSSFEDAVLIDIVSDVAPSTAIVFLDTQYHFAETLWYKSELERRYGIFTQTLTPAERVQPDNRWQVDVEGCCGVRKVEPLQRALQGRSGWLTGIRRADGPSRADAPVVSWDDARGLAKINPLVAWSDDDVANYIATNNLPAHPLTERGYPSIGCWPCTRPVAPGEDRRAGRWAGQTKTECGLHA